jgi:hypothetical protein
MSVVAGSFAYRQASGTVVGAGNGQALHAVFTPTDTANHTGGSVDTTISVSRAPLSATAANAVREYGVANPVFTGTLAGVVNGDSITANYTSAATPSSPVGNYPIVVSLSDPAGRLSNYTVALTNGTLTVGDTTAPVISAVTPSVKSIWPPNKRMVAESIAIAVTDNADASPSCQVTSVSSNESEAGEWTITGPLSVSLLANRNGNGNGRVYTIGVRCTDASGNASMSSTTVTVPHDQGK